MFFKSVEIRLGLLCLFLTLGSTLFGQALHTNAPCATGNASTPLQFEQGGFLDWDTPGNLVQVFTDVGRPGQTITYTISGNTASLINSPGNGTPTPNVDFFFNSYADALSLMTSGIGNGNSNITVLIEFSPAIPGNLGYEVYHINQSGSGDFVKMTAQTTQGATINPTFTTPATPSYQLIGQNSVNADTFTSIDDGQLGVNFSSTDSIVSTTIIWKDCNGCPSGNHGVAIGDFEFCRLFLDNDKDLVEDHIDVDDDNDGIPDVTESCNSPFSDPDQDTIQVDITLDSYPDETTWDIRDDLGNILASGGPYDNPTDIGSTIQTQLILSAGQNATFNIYDSFGDALTFSPTGNYSVFKNGNLIAGPDSSNWGFQSSESIPALGVPFDGFSCVGGDYAYDFDDDGILNYRDADYCLLNPAGVCYSLDEDGDGIINGFDMDADNDGIPDDIEAQGAVCYMPPSSTVDARGLPTNFVSYLNCADNSSASTYGIIPNVDNSDSDDIHDYLDLDTDGDGIADFAEAFDYNSNLMSIDDYLTLAGNFSPQGGSVATYSTNVDTDGDFIVDWLDNLPNSPGFDHSSLPPFQDPFSGFFFDLDRDGIVDLFDPDQGGAIPLYPPDADFDNDPDWRDLDNDSSLPVDFAGFDVFRSGKSDASLRWVTSLETRLSHFEVERSEDGIQFNIIGSVEIAGTGQGLTSYDFLDLDIVKAVENEAFYRIKAVNLNGGTIDSEIRILNLDNSEESIDFRLYPNPSNGILNIYLEGILESATLTFYNANGKKVWSENMNIDRVLETQKDLSGLGSGIYLGVLEYGSKKETMKILLH